ncbi:hypothetical protein [Methylobacterium sp. A54F]
MMLFDRLRENAEAIRALGAAAIARAHRAGVPAYAMDPALGDGLVRHMPDGTRQRVAVVDGVEVVIETYTAED